MPLNYGKVLCRYWTTGTGKRLRGDKAAQILSLYLFSAPGSNMLGIYYCPLSVMAHDTGLSRREAAGALDRLAGEEVAFYDPADELVYVPGSLKVRTGDRLKDGDNRIAGIQGELDLLGHHQFALQLVDRYNETHHLRIEMEPHPKGLPSPFEGPSKALGYQKQKQDQDQEQKQKQDHRARANGWSSRFQEFWGVWPYRVAKAQAETTFRKLYAAGELPEHEDFVRAIRWQVENGCLQPRKARDGRDTRPHPSSWLNGKRWLDEKPAEAEWVPPEDRA